MDRLDDMAAFVKVVDTESFTGAAERLGRSKSAISRRMSELENRLGVRLLNRTTRRLSVTEVGRAFYERCVRIIADLDEAEHAVSALHASPRGTLRINAPVSFATRHLAPAVGEFLDRHPEITIEMDLNDRIVDLIDEGYDLAVRIAHLRDSSLIARRLAPCRLAVCASPAYLARHGTPASPDQLADRNCLIYSNGPAPHQWLFQIEGTVRPIKVAGNLKVNHGDILADAAIAGLGIAILPTFLIGTALADRRLICLFRDQVVSDLSVYAVYPHNRHLSSKVRSFVDFLASRFGPAPDWDRALADRTEDGRLGLGP